MIISLKSTQFCMLYLLMLICYASMSISIVPLRHGLIYFNFRKGWGQLFVETAAGVESDREDPTARAFEADTDDARVELAKDAASFGYYTAGVEVWDKDYDTAIEKATYVSGLINSTGWGAADV